MLRGSKAFDRLFQQGRRFYFQGVTLIVDATAQECGVAFCASRKINAVMRNRSKRILRATLMPFLGQVRGDISVAFFAEPRFLQKNHPERIAIMGKALGSASAVHQTREVTGL